MTFWAYMLRCRDGSYHLGHTDHLDYRIGQHQSGEIPGYTATRRPVELVWSAEFPTRFEALEAERRIKGWSRAKKEALIREDWAAIHRRVSRAKVLRDGTEHSPGSASAPPQDERNFSTAPQASRRGPVIVLVRPQLGENIGSGGYGDATLADEFYWAAAELFVTTGAPHYRAAIEASPFFREPQAGEFGWPTTATLGTIALATLPNALPEADRKSTRLNSSH